MASQPSQAPNSDAVLKYFKISFGSRLKKHGPGADWAVHADSATELEILQELVQRGYVVPHDQAKHFALTDAGVAWLRTQGF